MPIYDYKCSKCGHSFEVMQKMSAPPAPCPAPTGLPGITVPGNGHGPDGFWADFWAGVQTSIKTGKPIPYPAAPTFIDVGPDYEHTVIYPEGEDASKWPSKKQTLAEWLAESVGPCGGETIKQMSRSSFHLKGTGWYKTDYKD